LPGQLLPTGEGTGSERGGLEEGVFDPEGTSGIPLCSGPRRGAVVEAADHGSQSINAVAACEYAGLGPLKLVGVTTLIIDGFSHSDSFSVD
jgi:hypothetical protein